MPARASRPQQPDPPDTSGIPPTGSTPAWARSWGLHPGHTLQHTEEAGGSDQSHSSQASSPTKHGLPTPMASRRRCGPSVHVPSSPPIPPAQLHRWLGDPPPPGEGGWPPPGRATAGARHEGFAAPGGTPQSRAQAAASDPVTYQTPAEKEALADSSNPTAPPSARGAARDPPAGGSGGWDGIPAYRPGAASEARPGLADKPGAVVKMGRRAAWLRTLAYEGSWQLCLEAMLGGQAEIAVQFLQDRCAALRGALELDGLLLGTAASTGGGAGHGEAAMYWDDKEEAPLAAVECVAAEPASPRCAPQFYDPDEGVVDEAEEEGVPEVEEVQEPAPHSGPRRSEARWDPLLQTTCVRVVGCEALSAAPGGGGAPAPADPAPRTKHYVCMYPAGVGGGAVGGRRRADPETGGPDGGAWTLVGSDGATHRHAPVELGPETSLRGTLVVELHAGRALLATGTVQLAELQDLAARQDVFAPAPAPGGAGFLKSLFPCLRHRGGGQASMAWVKLVDEAGRTAGHAVLSPRIVTPVGPRGLEGPMGPPRGAGVKPAPRRPEAGEGPGGRVVRHKAPPARRPRSPPVWPLAGVRREAEPHGLARVDTRGADLPPPNCNNGGGAGTNGGGVGYLQATALQAYDELLRAALGAQGCGRRNLTPEGPWRWLLAEFASAYGVRPQYAALSYLKWVVGEEVASLTSDCFGVLARELAPLHAARAAAALSSGELGVLAQVCNRVDGLLAQCFENYFMLSEDTVNGLTEGALSVRGATPPVLTPATELFCLLRDPGNPADADWLAARFRLAARKRYAALLTAAELQQPGPGGLGAGGRRREATPDGDGPDAVAAYARVEELCRAVANELRADDDVRDAGVLPPCVSLPDLTSLEYVKGIISHVKRVLARYPPPAPTEAAVRLVEAVGKLQDFVYRHGYREACARLNSRDIFGRFVQEWIGASGAALRALCRSLEPAAPAGGGGWADGGGGGAGGHGGDGKRRVSPLVEEMTSASEREMARYERIITYWPMYGPDLERAVTGALRDATAAVSRQCGLVQTKDAPGTPEGGRGGGQALVVAARGYGAGAGRSPSPGVGEESPASRAGGQRSAWKWVVPRNAPTLAYRGAPAALARGITPGQALLLNSLRHLLAFSPQLEHRLGRWCGGAAVAASAAAFPPVAVGSERIARDAPDLGAQSAQLVKELRSEYFAAITLCAERLAAELAANPATSTLLLLRRDGLTAHPSQLQSALSSIMEELERLLHWLSSSLDTRVYVAVTRGLWDLTSKDVLEYAEDLQEGGGGQRGAWRGRQNASVAVRGLDAFFKSMLTASMGNDLLSKDLGLPAHSDRAHKLLAENLSGINHSYDVY
ncbi:CGL46 [Auxenochlorella protothecoides x Auxenochlorella symbiontica]